jgi:hypothetical protein
MLMHRLRYRYPRALMRALRILSPQERCCLLLLLHVKSRLRGRSLMRGPVRRQLQLLLAQQASLLGAEAVEKTSSLLHEGQLAPRRSFCWSQTLTPPSQASALPRSLQQKLLRPPPLLLSPLEIWMLPALRSSCHWAVSLC